MLASCGQKSFIFFGTTQQAKVRLKTWQGFPLFHQSLGRLLVAHQLFSYWLPARPGKFQISPNQLNQQAAIGLDGLGMFANKTLYSWATDVGRGQASSKLFAKVGHASELEKFKGFIKPEPDKNLNEQTSRQLILHVK